MTANLSTGNESSHGNGRKSVLVVGAGQRGMVGPSFTSILYVHADDVRQIYSQYALQHPTLVKIIGVADLSPFRRKVTARTHQ